MQKVYIAGSSIISALGNNKKECIENLKKIKTESDYADYTKNNHNFFSIKKEFSSQKEKLESIIKSAVEDAILDAGLSSEEIADLYVFVGSTSTSISVREEENKEFLEGKTNLKIKEMGHGNLCSFIESVTGSRYKATMFQSACTSSDNAFSYAVNLIKNKRIKRAIVIGFELFNTATYQGFKSLMLLSESGKCKPLDKNSDGIVLGEACSAVILDSKKVLPDDFECLSSNGSFDNYSLTNSHPDGDVTLDCMKDAITKAGIRLEEISCLKAHSTGTPSSSLSEARAIDRLFKCYKCEVDVVSLKPVIGHTLGACGVTEIVLLCESIKNGFIPKAFGFSEKYDDISFPMLTTQKVVDRAAILLNFIGFGGSNSSIVLTNKTS